MTFFKVNDPKNRKLIEDVIAKRAVIREADRRRKMGDAFEYEQLSRFFKPITKQVEKTEEKIEKGVKGLPGEIAKVLPRPINIMQQMQPMQPPPAYEPPFAGEEEIPEAEEKTEEKGEEVLPPYISKYENYYNISGFPLDFDHKKKQIISLKNNKVINNSPDVYDILTNINSNKKWEDLKDEDQTFLGYILTNNKAIYSDYGLNYRENYELKSKKNPWKDIYSHIWFNRFLYMNDEMFEKEKKQAKRYLTNKDNRITQETKEKIRQRMKKGEGLKGSGLKKNYVTLPSEPSELVDRLTLLSGSKDAGNTGVYNEMVSICDELLKRKIIGKGQYKQFLSNI